MAIIPGQYENTPFAALAPSQGSPAPNQGHKGPNQPRRKKASRLSKESTPARYLSKTDEDRLARIKREEFQCKGNPQLVKEHFKSEKELYPGLTRNGFRNSLNRIRRTEKLPTSAFIRKKVTSVDHSESDQS
jgi:hypothetical protein